MVGGLLPAQVAAQASFYIWPPDKDYGHVAVGGSLHAGIWLYGVSPADSIFITFQGPNASEWQFTQQHAQQRGPGGTWYSRKCAIPPTASAPSCIFGIVFAPQSAGVKTAELVVTASRGRRAVAPLLGIGIQPTCTFTVVPCNYAHHYSGTFSWSVNLSGEAGSNELGLLVGVTDGKAACTGSEISRQPGGTSWTGHIVGPGILGIEFLPGARGSLTYRITVACPSARFPDHPDGSTGRPSEPARLGSSYSIVIDPQRAEVVGDTLTGTLNFPAPESDPLNGVTGSVAVQWKLTLNPPRQAPPPPPPPPPPPQPPSAPRRSP